MNQLIAHLIGDYVLQNHWMAINKTTNSFAAWCHVCLYGIPFLFLVDSWTALAVIVGTHFVIDRFRLAQYWVDFWGSGKEGAVLTSIMHTRGYVVERILNGEEYWVDPDHLPGDFRDGIKRIQPASPFLSVWLLIIIDNTMHLCINAIALAWL